MSDYVTVEAVPATVDNFGFTTINLRYFLDELHSRTEHTISTRDLIKFVSTLGKNKTSGNNAISRLQYFLNAYIQESTLKVLNKNLEFIGNDHDVLVRGATGTNDADFYFYSIDGNTYTIDVKIFFSEASYDAAKKNTNFHNADYSLIYLIDKKSWYFSKKADNYSSLFSLVSLMYTDPHLNEIKLPNTLTLIRFFTPELQSSEFRKLSDADVPAYVNYEFYN